jgi:hypothetical protein
MIISFREKMARCVAWWLHARRWVGLSLFT